MIRLLTLTLLALLLQACATTPPATVTITTATGHVYAAAATPVENPRIHANGERMDWVELAVVKVHGGLPPEPRKQPVWACMGADLGTTGAGLALGLTEANPLGLGIAIPIGVGEAIWAKRIEKRGDPMPAKVFAVMHCGAAIWNALVILSILL